MHRTVTNTFFSILLIALILIVVPANAFAASASASVTASSSTIKPGQSVTVRITFSGPDIGGVEGAFSYNSSLLQFISSQVTAGSGEISNGRIVLYSSGNASSLSGTITFKALREGAATVSASECQIYSFHEEKPLGTVSASTRVTIKSPSSGGSSPSKPDNGSSSNTSEPKDTNKPSESDTKEEQEETTKNPVEEAIKVTLGNEQLYLWKDLSSVKLPDGFKTGEAFYKTVRIQVAVGNNQDITLAYLTDENGKTAVFTYWITRTTCILT